MPNVGDPILASQFAILNPWVSYTPVLTAVTTNPTNWTGVGRYVVIGKTCHYYFNFTAASTFTAGSGDYIVSLPVTLQGYIFNDAVGYGAAVNTTVHPTIATVWTSTSVKMVRASTEAFLGSAGPGTAWASGHDFTASGTVQTS